MSITQSKLPNMANFLQSACNVVKSKSFQVSFGAAFAFTAVWVISSSQEGSGMQLGNLGNKAEPQLNSSLNDTLQLDQFLPVCLLGHQPSNYSNLTNSNFSIKLAEEALPFKPLLQGQNVKSDQTLPDSSKVQIDAYEKDGSAFLGRVFMKNENFCPALNSFSFEAPNSTTKRTLNVTELKNTGINWSKWAWGAGGGAVVMVGARILTFKVIKPISASVSDQFSMLLYDLCLRIIFG